MNAPTTPLPAGFDPKLSHLVTAWAADKPLNCCRFDPKGRYVFCGLEGPDVQRFNLADGKRVTFPGGHDSWVFALAFSADGTRTFSGGGDGRVVEWPTDSDAPKPLRTIEAHRGWIRAMGTSPDGKLLATGGNDKAVRLWDPATGKLVRELLGHKGHVYSLEFHPDGKSLLSGDLLGEIKQWNLADGKPLGSFDAKPLHTYEGGQQVDFGGVRGLAIAPDGKSVSAGGLHKATNPLGAVHEPIVLRFEGDTRKKLRTQLADGITQGLIWRLRYLADATLMGVSGGASGGFLVFWKPDADKDYHRLGLPNIARDMDLHPDGLQVATAHHDKFVRISKLSAKKA